MFAGSGRSSRGKIDRPFRRGVLQRGRAIAERYQIVVREEDGEFYGRGLEMPCVMNDGKTAAQFVKATRVSLTPAVAYLLESGKSPPAPASENRRSEQVNIRLTPEERLLLEEAAHRKGFRGVSDCVQNTSLASIDH